MRSTTSLLPSADAPLPIPDHLPRRQISLFQAFQTSGRTLILPIPRQTLLITRTRPLPLPMRMSSCFDKHPTEDQVLRLI